MKLKITKIQYLHYKVCVYIIVIVSAGISGYIDYQRWLNPLGMSPEQNPKQHNGAQEFTPPDVFESSVTLPDGRPTSTLILKEEAEQASELSAEDLAVFDELRQLDEEYQGEIVVDQ